MAQHKVIPSKASVQPQFVLSAAEGGKSSPPPLREHGQALIGAFSVALKLDPQEHSDLRQMALGICVGKCESCFQRGGSDGEASPHAPEAMD